MSLSQNGICFYWSSKPRTTLWLVSFRGLIQRPSLTFPHENPPQAFAMFQCHGIQTIFPCNVTLKQTLFILFMGRPTRQHTCCDWENDWVLKMFAYNIFFDHKVTNNLRINLLKILRTIAWHLVPVSLKRRPGGKFRPRVKWCRLQTWGKLQTAKFLSSSCHDLVHKRTGRGAGEGGLQPRLSEKQ